jgi:hypothetical protein
METSERPLTPPERSWLERGSSTNGPVRQAVIAGLLTFMGGLGLLLVVLPPGQEHGTPSLVASGVAALAAVVVALRVGRRARGDGMAEELRRDLAAGLARVVRYRVREALAIEDTEDGRSLYLLHLEDGSVAFLAGAYLDEAESEGAFPTAVVDVARAPASGLVLQLAGSGAPVPVVARLTELPEALRHLDLEDGARVPVAWEALAPR